MFKTATKLNGDKPKVKLTARTAVVSTVLHSATSHSYGVSLFFSGSTLGVRPPTDFHTKSGLIDVDSHKCLFAVKIATFSNPWALTPAAQCIHCLQCVVRLRLQFLHVLAYTFQIIGLN